MSKSPAAAAPPRLNRVPILLATWFGVGRLPVAPGTWGSLAALPCAWALYRLGGSVALIAATVVVFCIGLWAADAYIAASENPDPAPVVIDEVAGQWLTLLVVPADLILYALGFVLFRLFDILKPWPISWADRNIKGGFGIMFDDILAGVYAGIILLGINYWFGG